MENFREELRYEYNLNPDSVVLDCGGYEGRFADEIFRRYGCTVHVLEPVKPFYDKIVERFHGNPKIHVHNYGIGGENDSVKFSIKGDMTGAYADNPETEEVKIVDVAEILAEFGPKIDLLKLNVEGSEFSVLEAMVRWSMLGIVENIQVQWHDVVPDAKYRYDKLQERLARTHHLTFDHGWVWQNWLKNEQ